MMVAHSDMNIPTIPGLQPHPVQVAEQQRLAELRKNDATLAAAPQPGSPRRSSSIMPEQTRDSLKRLVNALRKASGVPGDSPPEPDHKPAPAPSADRRAEIRAPSSSGTADRIGQP
jgi:penicillin-binding protein 1A